MKKTKLLMPLTAVSVLTAAVPAITLASCSKKGEETETIITKEEWENAFKLLDERTDGVCWHTSEDSYISFGYNTSYSEATAGYRFSDIECGQKYSKLSAKHKNFVYETDPITTYSTMNTNALNQMISLDSEGNIDSTSVSTAVDFQSIFDLFDVYAPAYDYFTYDKEEKVFVFNKNTSNDVTITSSKVKFNDSKQIEYIESVAQEPISETDTTHITINLHFTYDKTEVTIPSAVTAEMNKNLCSITSMETKVSYASMEDGFQRGLILHISGIAFSKITATYTEGSLYTFTPDTTEVYKNGKIMSEEEYTIEPGDYEYIQFPTAIAATDTIDIGINLSSDRYYGGTDALVFNLTA